MVSWSEDKLKLWRRPEEEAMKDNSEWAGIVVVVVAMAFFLTTACVTEGWMSSEAGSAIVANPRYEDFGRGNQQAKVNGLQLHREGETWYWLYRVEGKQDSSKRLTYSMLAVDLHTPPLGEVGQELEVSGDNLTGEMILKLPEKLEE